MLIRLLTGEVCSVFLPADRVVAFMRWCETLHQPDKSQVLAVVKKVAGFRHEERRQLPRLWRFEERIQGIAIFAIRYAQVRLYCCQHHDDLIILEWCRKKRKKADRTVLERAAAVALQIIEDENG